jgi:putative aminopeptidase FrvX
MQKITARAVLQKVLSLPTAPLYEHHVIEFVRQFVETHGLRVRQDRSGNLFVRNRASGRSRVVVMAHMDHPGVEVMASRGTRLRARVRGGVHRPHLQGARMAFYPNTTSRVVGRVTAVNTRGHLTIDTPTPVPAQSFGAFALPRPTMRGNRVAATAIDNLANCASILWWLYTLRRSRVPVTGILTRGEEIGFWGAEALVRAESLPKTTPIIVLEASAARPAGVEFGAGPVIRVGDRLTSFDPHIDCWLQSIAAWVQKKEKAFRFQRALMTGGRMEASLYILAGYRVGSLALPLGNYHNRGARGPAHEYCDWRDWQGLQSMLQAMVRAPSMGKVVTSLQRAIRTTTDGR